MQDLCDIETLPTSSYVRLARSSHIYITAMTVHDCEAQARCSLPQWQASRGGSGQYGRRCTRFNLSRMSLALQSAVVWPRYRRISRVDPKAATERESFS